MQTPLHDRLVEPMQKYIDIARPILLKGERHSFVFVNRRGGCFSPSTWCLWIQHIFYKVCGVCVSNNTLRRSFITYLQQQGISPELRHSVAEAMGHSILTAQRFYDRCTPYERRLPGLQLASALAQSLSSGGV